MAEFEPRKMTANDFNNGNKFRDFDSITGYEGDTPRADDFNNMIENQLFTQGLATNQPDVSEANNVGTASVSIVTKADGTPQIKFTNLKGDKGDKGDAPQIYYHHQTMSFTYNNIDYQIEVGKISAYNVSIRLSTMGEYISMIKNSQFGVRIHIDKKYESTPYWIDYLGGDGCLIYYFNDSDMSVEIPLLAGGVAEAQITFNDSVEALF